MVAADGEARQSEILDEFRGEGFNSPGPLLFGIVKRFGKKKVFLVEIFVF